MTHAVIIDKQNNNKRWGVGSEVLVTVNVKKKQTNFQNLHFNSFQDVEAVLFLWQQTRTVDPGHVTKQPIMAVHLQALWPSLSSLTPATLMPYYYHNYKH